MSSPISNLIDSINKSSLGWKYSKLDIRDGDDDHLDYLYGSIDMVYIFTTKIDIEYLMGKANEILAEHGDSYRHTNSDNICGVFLWNSKFVTIPSKILHSVWTRFFGHDEMSECVICMEIPKKPIGMTLCMICCSITCSSCVKKIRDAKCPICRTYLDM